MAHPSMKANLKDVWAGETLGCYGIDQGKKTPFRVYVYPNLFDDEIVVQLRNDINSSIKLKTKDNDLYKLKQSKDLKTEIPSKKLTPVLHKFIDEMIDSLKPHLEELTGKVLSNKNFDITASRYDVGNYLLCHNDDIRDNVKRHGRTLAFIYYLNSRPWTKEDGGSLILFDSDSLGQPVEVNNSILPRPNTLVVFEVSPTSWHSVGEVYCKDDFRLSINGWFHSDIPSKFAEVEKKIESCPYTFIRPVPLNDRVERFFKECLNQEYLMNKTCLLIKKRFLQNSEINLINFLAKDKYQQISDALKEATMSEENLSHVGPYNKRNYRVLKIDKLPQPCKDLYDAFRSELFFMLLSRLTGLDLQPPSLKSSTKEDNDDSSEDDDTDELSDEEEDEEEDEDEGEDESENGGESPIIIAQAISQDLDDGRNKDQQTIVSELCSKEDKCDSENAKEGLGSSLKQTNSEEPTTSKEKRATDDKKGPKKRKRTADPLARFEFRSLEAGSYTLMHDHGYELGEKSALDVMLHFNHDFGVNFEHGGYITYIDAAPDEDMHDMDCELLTVEPKSNCLSLVYRCDEGSCRFLKHISRSHRGNYQDLYCVYYERPDDLPSSTEKLDE